MHMMFEEEKMDFKSKLVMFCVICYFAKKLSKYEMKEIFGA